MVEQGSAVGDWCQHDAAQSGMGMDEVTSTNGDGEVVLRRAGPRVEHVAGCCPAFDRVQACKANKFEE